MHLRIQKGFSLVELLIAMVVASLLATFTIRAYIDNLDETTARGLVAQRLSGYTNAVRQRLSFQGAAAAFPNPNEVFVGVDWIKGPACVGGLAPEEFLPCNFQNIIAQAGGVGFTTTVINNAGVLNAIIVVDNGAAQGYFLRGGIRPDLAGAAVSSAAGFSVNNLTPAGLVTFADYQSNPANAVITITVDTNPLTDPWVRTDGNNSMNADFDFSGVGFDIDNANDVESSSFTDRDNANFGIDPNQLSQLNNVNITNANIQSTVTGSLSAINAGINAASIGELTADTISAQTIASDLVASGAYYDKDDTSFFIDANGLSRVNDVIISSKGDLPLSALLPNLVLLETYRVGDGAVVPKPSCAATGEAKVIVVPNTLQSYLREPADDAGTPHTRVAAQSSVSAFSAVDNGGSWTISLLSYNYESDTYEPSLDGLAAAIAEVYCKY